jgi:hypothetical protein
MRSCVCFARGAVHVAGVLPLPGITLALAPLPCVLACSVLSWVLVVVAGLLTVQDLAVNRTWHGSAINNAACCLLAAC